MPTLIAVVGPSQPDRQVYESAYQIGQFLGKHPEVVVLNGGMGGVMEATAKGVQEAGGICIGLLPTHTKTDGNPYLSVALPTGLGPFRNYLLAQACDLMVAVGESPGTRTEVTMALRLGKPVLAVHWQTPLPGLQQIPDLDTLYQALSDFLKG